MAKPRRKKKKRRGKEAGRKKSGVMLGMRSGFKNVAGSVTGTKPASSKKSGLIGTAITVLLVAAAAALLYKRFG